MSTQDKDKEAVTAEDEDQTSVTAAVIPLKKESFLTNLENNIFEITLPSDVYYNFWAMNFYGTFEEQPLVNRIIYVFFMVVTLVAQILGVSGIWWSEVSGNYAWDDIKLDLSANEIDRVTIFSENLVYPGNKYYFEQNINDSITFNDTIVSLEALNISDNAVKQSVSVRFFNEIEAKTSTSEETDELTVMMKFIAITIMVIRTATDILTHYKVAVTLGRPMRQNMFSLKNGNVVVCPMLLDVIVFLQILFTLYIMAASATSIVGANNSINAYFMALALLLIVSFDDMMLTFLNTIMYIDPTHKLNVLTIRVKVNDKIKKNLMRFNDSNEIVLVTTLVIVVYGILLGVINAVV